MQPRIVAESAPIHHGWIKKLDENLLGDIGVAQLLRNNLSANTKICTISCSVNAPLDLTCGLSCNLSAPFCRNLEQKLITKCVDLAALKKTNSASPEDKSVNYLRLSTISMCL